MVLVSRSPRRRCAGVVPVATVLRGWSVGARDVTRTAPAGLVIGAGETAATPAGRETTF